MNQREPRKFVDAYSGRFRYDLSEEIQAYALEEFERMAGELDSAVYHVEVPGQREVHFIEHESLVSGTRAYKAILFDGIWDATRRIAELNDELRCTFQGGRVMVTPEVQTSPNCDEILESVRRYDWNQAQPGNDPYKEHDFGVVSVAGGRYFWKIDYYDPMLTRGSSDPANPEKTTRVLTIMSAEEY
jgi:hypothetical protein